MIEMNAARNRDEISVVLDELGPGAPLENMAGAFVSIALV
jgi:hypothetical protein